MATEIATSTAHTELTRGKAAGAVRISRDLVRAPFGPGVPRCVGPRCLDRRVDELDALGAEHLVKGPLRSTLSSDSTR
jgi:hypothetical protein